MNFNSPGFSFLGGILIGLAASWLLATTGRTAGVSGIAAGLMAPRPGDWGWRVAFLGGLVAGGLALLWWRADAIVAPAAPVTTLAMAGLLVGVGTRIGGGCTSGHGICGLSRLSLRSLVAVLTFIAVAMVTVAVKHLLAGGA